MSVLNENRVEDLDLKELKEYPVKIPTLRKVVKSATVGKNSGKANKGIVIDDHTHTMFGGVDCGVAPEKLTIQSYCED